MPKDMKYPHLQLKPEDCSEIGLLIVEHMEQHQLDLTAMAEKIGVSRTALRIACLRQGNPGKRIITKLATLLDKSEQELFRLDAKNKLELIYERNEDRSH